MFKKATRERIRKHKWSEHSNQTQFFKRIKEEIHLGFKDITLVAKELPEEQLEEIFTEKELERLIRIILKPRSKRTIMITEALAYQIWQKLARELPIDIVNNLSGDISKTWIYAKMLSQYADKPMLKQK